MSVVGLRRKRQGTALALALEKLSVARRGRNMKLLDKKREVQRIGNLSLCSCLTVYISVGVSSTRNPLWGTQQTCSERAFEGRADSLGLLGEWRERKGQNPRAGPVAFPLEKPALALLCPIV